MKRTYFILLIILTLSYSCKKKEYAVIKIFFKNITNERVLINKYKDKNIYTSTIDTNEYKIIEENTYGAYIPTSLISVKYDSIIFFMHNDTIIHSVNSDKKDNPFVDNSSWHYVMKYTDSHHCFSCKPFTVYDYCYEIK